MDTRHPGGQPLPFWKRSRHSQLPPGGKYPDLQLWTTRNNCWITGYVPPILSAATTPAAALGRAASMSMAGGPAFAGGYYDPASSSFGLWNVKQPVVEKVRPLRPDDAALLDASRTILRRIVDARRG